MLKADFFSLGLRPQYTFDQLIVGSHNQMAAAASLQVSKNLGEAYNPLVIFGPTGVGKTHMMQAIAHAVLVRLPEIKLKYISAERFVNDVISAISEDNLVGFRQHYNQLNLLLLDDVQYLIESRSAQGEFLHVFNNLHQQNCQIILTSDCSPHQLEGLDKTIRSRLEWGLSADVKIPDHTTRVEILKLKQKSFGLSVSEEALQFVAQLLVTSVRELEGFLKRLHAYVTLSHQPVTMALIKNVVMEIRPDAPIDQVPPIAAQNNSTPIILASDMNISSGSPTLSAMTPEPSESSSVFPDAIEKGINGMPAPVAHANGHGDVASISLPQPPEAPTPAPPPIFSQVVPAEQLEPSLNMTSNALPKPQPPEIAVSAPGVMSVQPVKKEYAKPPAVPPGVASDVAAEPSVPIQPIKSTAPAKKEYVKAPIVAPTYSDDLPASGASGSGAVSPSGPAEVLPSGESIEDIENEPLPPGHKEVGAAFFYPAGCDKQLESVYRKFQDVIKKHKLKYRLKRLANHPFQYKGKINYSEFVDICRLNKVPVAIVIGPPSDGGLTDQEFYDLLSVTLDVQGVSLQLVTWNEIDKDYRYLNLALDIALVRAR